MKDTPLKATVPVCRVVRYQQQTYRLVFCRHVPYRPATAIYGGPLILLSGRLQRDYLVLKSGPQSRPEWIGHTATLSEALQMLFTAQYQRSRQPAEHHSLAVEPLSKPRLS